MFESNYLLREDVLVDYMFKYKPILSKNRHRLNVYKIWPSDNLISFGVAYDINHSEFKLNSNGKRYINKHNLLSYKASLINFEEIKLKTKLKNKTGNLTNNVFI
jgi:hypothetical protein